MGLQDTIRKDMFKAKKDGNDTHAAILGMLTAALKNFQIEKGQNLTEDEEITVLRKEAKKLSDSYEQFTNGGREDLAAREKEQLSVVNGYLPKLMEREDIVEFVQKKIRDVQASSQRDIGMVMGLVMKELKGKADGGVVKSVVEELLKK